jgi:hypothetical protein
MPVTALHHFTIRCTPDELPPLVDFLVLLRPAKSVSVQIAKLFASL